MTSWTKRLKTWIARPNLNDGFQPRTSNFVCILCSTERTSDRFTPRRRGLLMTWCSRVVELEVHFCTPAKGRGQRHFTVEDGNLTMAYPHPCTGKTVSTSTCIESWRVLAAALPNPFSVGTQALWNRPQQKGAANLQLWDGVLAGRLGSSWVVWRILKKNGSQRSSLGGLQSVEQCDWKRKEHVEKSVNESLSPCEYRLKGERKTKGRRG